VFSQTFFTFFEVRRFFSRLENRSTNDRFSYLFIVLNFAIFAALREFFSFSVESSLFGKREEKPVAASVKSDEPQLTR